MSEFVTSGTECLIDEPPKRRYTVPKISTGTKGAETNVGKNQ